MTVNTLYASLSDLKAYIRAKADTGDDPILQICLEGACRAIDDLTGRNEHGFWLDASASARVYRTHGRIVFRYEGELLLLDEIADTTGLIVEGTTWDTYTTLTGFELEQESAISLGKPVTGLMLPFNSWAVYRKIRVTAIWGWPAVPAVVRQAALIQASRYFSRKDSTNGVMGDPQWGLMRVPYMDPDVKTLLRHLCLPGFA